MDNLITTDAQGLIDETAQAKKGQPKKNINGKVTFVQNPLKLFSIVFNHAYPLDLSIIKYCFQGCPFCFATANKRATGDVIGKTIDPTDQFIKLLQKANGQGYNNENIIEYCLHNKYPVVFSNNVDPFLPASEEQFKLGERVLEAALEHNQPLFVQTKEVYYGDRVKELLIKGKHLFHLYVSISTTDYDKAKQYETVAVTPQERFDRIKELTDAGMTATVALNPYCPEWEPNLKEYFQKVKDCGAVGVYTYPLHLTSTQKKVMPKRFGEFTQKADRYDDFYADTVLMEKICADLDLKLHYPRRMPDDFYNGNGMWTDKEVWPIDPQRVMEHVHQAWLEEKSPVIIEWKDVDAYFEKHSPEVWNAIFKVTEFAGCLWTDNENYFRVSSALGKRNRLKNICRYLWNNPDSQDQWFSFYHHNFQLVDSEGNNGEVENVLDDNNDLIMVYDPNYTKDGWFYDQNDEDVEFVELEG